ncbi:hypothetical protein GYMLUDRAFT_74700 [Collybiopsis luxurians FD-317 M1]|uniref:Uncharacterized protein n=1 Tax=Collybiopsis luxurians FD-317 M1 TaxID=944289 RepID=A0A0D0CTS1_9AGAR|nr:hypothetical protein GYMLUDRAFT_74700 [Collybiopsis luxurians FD-317 M1]
MQDRLLPIYSVMQLEQDEKRALQDKVDRWQSKISEVRASAAEVKKLTEELEKAERVESQLSDQLEAEREENRKLRKDAVDQRRITKEMEAMVLRLLREKEDAAKRAKASREVLRALSKGSSSSRGHVSMIQD